MDELDSNNLKTKIQWVCNECGLEANRLTCLKRYGKKPKKDKFSLSTYHKGKCDYCGKKKMITQTRDFFHPDFNLLNKQR